MEKINFYDLFNTLKKKVWAIEKEDELEPLKKEYNNIYIQAKRTLSENSFSSFKENTLSQFNEAIAKKVAFLNKKKTYTVKQNYIFREEEGKAFSALCYALTEFISMKINKNKNI